MKLTPPKQITFWIGVVLAVLGLIAFFMPAFAAYAFWLVFVGFVLLFLGLTIKGL